MGAKRSFFIFYTQIRIMCPGQTQPVPCTLIVFYPILWTPFIGVIYKNERTIDLVCLKNI